MMFVKHNLKSSFLIVAKALVCFVKRGKGETVERLL